MTFLSAIIQNFITGCFDDSEHCLGWIQDYGCNYGDIANTCKKTCNLCVDTPTESTGK